MIQFTSFIRVGILFALIMLFMNCIGQATNSYYDLALKKYQEENYEYAEVLIEKAVNLDSTFIWNYILYSDILLERGKIYQSLSMISKAYFIDSLESQVYDRLGFIYHMTGNLDTSVLNYNKALSLAKTSNDMQYVLMKRGLVKMTFRDFEGAKEDFHYSLQYDPLNPLVLNNLATLHGELNNFDSAIHYLELVFNSYPSRIAPIINLGLYCTKIGKYGNALDWFERALFLDDENPFIYSNRASTYRMLGKPYLALDDINQSIGFYSNNSYAYRTRGLILIALDEVDSGCKDLYHAQKLGFEKNYGSEVKDLIELNCKK